jgi:hypothetical protein
VLPPSEEVMRHFLPGVVPALDTLGLSLTEATERITPELAKRQRGPWTAEGPYAPGQPLGEAVAHFCLRLLTLRGVVCFAPRAGNKVVGRCRARERLTAARRPCHAEPQAHLAVRRLGRVIPAR